MPVGTEKNAILGASGGDNFEFALGQSGPGYSTQGGFALGSSAWYAACGNGGGGEWRWTTPVCPCQNPDNPSAYGGFHGVHYRNQSKAANSTWHYSLNGGADWTQLPTEYAGYQGSTTCGSGGYQNSYCNNSSEIFALDWKCEGGTGKWDFSLQMFVKWVP